MIQMTDLSINNKEYNLTINSRTGALASFIVNGRELISNSNNTSLFKIRLKGTKDNFTTIASLQATTTKTEHFSNKDAIIFSINYSNINNLNINATVTITCPKNASATYWNIEVDNQTEKSIDYIDFPNIQVPKDLIGNGGDAKIFLPHQEGVLIEDLSVRETTWLKAVPLEYPNTGWIGYYPANVAMQYMAYYGKDAGLYFGAHDAEHNIKGIQVYEQEENSVLMQFRLYPGNDKAGKYTMPYQMVIGGFEGDWYVAADKYRDWFESARTVANVKLIDNKRLPEWYTESPVIITYPIRGTIDTGDMTPNEFYPYTNALPFLDKISESTDSKVMALLMHWEGSAPWAPPYIWPPYGDVNNFKKFEKSLHKKGNLLGLYASGTGYTLQSNTDPSYDMTEVFEKENLSEAMCVAPDGNLATNGVCVGDNVQRSGYDMCVSHLFVKEVVTEEIKKIIPNNIDYMQYFDQNIGGNGYFCYADDHNHPVTPGKWMNEAMVNIYKEVENIVDKSGAKIVIGCEGAAASPFIPYLLLNDLRFSMNFGIGRPVPAYAHLNHEYVNNFMGNQVNTFIIDYKKSPLNLQQRIAYSFTSGDLTTLVIESKGRISWGWGTAWDLEEKPDTEAILKLVKNLNAWRKNIGKDFLVYGRMEKPFVIDQSYNAPIVLGSGKYIDFNSLFTTKWRSQDGKLAQIFANSTNDVLAFIVNCKGSESKKVKYYKTATSKPINLKVDDFGKLELNIPALSAIMIVF